MNEYEDNQLRRQFKPIIDGLESLGSEIRAEKFPGVAWKAPKRSAWKMTLWPAAAAAAAAMILLAMFATNGFNVRGVNKQADQRVANTSLEPREDDLLVMEMLVRDVPEFDWNYKPSVEEEYDWWMNEVSTSRPAVDM